MRLQMRKSWQLRKTRMRTWWHNAAQHQHHRRKWRRGPTTQTNRQLPRYAKLDHHHGRLSRKPETTLRYCCTLARVISTECDDGPRLPEQEDGYPSIFNEAPLRNCVLQSRFCYSNLRLRALLDSVTKWCSERPGSVQDMANKLHDDMAPVNPVLDQQQPELRSKFRIEFIDTLLEKAGELSRVIANDPEWKTSRACFAQGADFLYRET
ncbi:hypothetical protein V8E54_013513 [Elaphomyces granulatus]